MALSEKQENEMFEAVIRLDEKINGKGGLMDRFEALCRGHGRLKRNFWIAVSIVAGGGGIFEGVSGGALLRLIGS